MSKIARFILIFVGFAVFLVLFIRAGFLLGLTINPMTFVFAFLIYIVILSVFFVSSVSGNNKTDNVTTLIIFIFSIVILSALSLLLGRTYDTSWDGQGYHQTAVIALANGWNPIYEKQIDLGKRLPSQIFAEGYPSALWEIEASIYTTAGRINSAKIVNFASALIAFAISVLLLRKFKINIFLSLALGFLLVMQPIFLIQSLTFMADGFGFQLLIIAASSLILFASSKKALFTIPVFLLTEVLLVSTKYNNLPIALFLGFVFMIIFSNRLLNKEYKNVDFKKLYLLGFLLISASFAYLPYGRNLLFHKAIFYPTNITEYSGSITYNNVPLNLRNEDRWSLLFYGIYSRTQSSLSGDPRNSVNVANLKIPFSLSPNEIEDSTALFNNRVGAGGVFFSGIITLSILLLLASVFTTKVRRERYVIYGIFFSLFVIISLSLLTPAPNLLRYVTQLQLVPFVILIPILAFFKNSKLKYAATFLIFLIFINSSLFGYALTQRKIKEFDLMNKQFETMRMSQNEYDVKAQHFYSNYIILKEQNVPFAIADHINCHPLKELLASSTTTQYCTE